MEIEQMIQQCANTISEINFCPKVALVLGSGLGNYTDQVRIVSTLSYSSIQDFPVSTVAGHAGQFVFGYIGDIPVVIMQGRVHYYEGYEMSDVVLPIRLMKLLGADVLFLTNAAGGIHPDLAVGDLMLLTDHIASFVPSPLRGENIEDLGPRFPDMSCVYDSALRQIIHTAAASLDVPLREGVYLQTTGPQFETPAEIRMFRQLGADAVGMSTACEAVAARHMGMRVCGISCITNMASGISKTALSHAETTQNAALASAAFTALVSESILRMGNL